VPRHTHPPRRAKHDRAALRAQRDRYITRRFRRAKRDGTLDHLCLTPSIGHRNALGLAVYEAEHDRIRDELAALGVALDPSSNSITRLGVHPEILRRMPRALTRETSGFPFRGAMAAVADHDAFWRYCRGCSACKPYRHEPGYRTRVKRFDQAEIEAGLTSWDDGEPTVAGRASANCEPRLIRGWC
jgi:hypothetical protein